MEGERACSPVIHRMTCVRPAFTRTVCLCGLGHRTRSRRSGTYVDVHRVSIIVSFTSVNLVVSLKRIVSALSLRRISSVDRHMFRSMFRLDAVRSRVWEPVSWIWLALRRSV